MKSQLDTLVEALAAGTWQPGQAQEPNHEREAKSAGRADDVGIGRFAQPHARLFPLLARKVRTPAGVGMLWQVFAEQSGVLLDEDARWIVRYFLTTEIEPVVIEGDR